MGQAQLYSGTSRIEGLYYRMFQFHNVYAWKGAYHFSADFAHWYGWAHLQLSLIEIKEADFSWKCGGSVLERSRKPVFVIPLPSKKTNIDWDKF